MKIKDAILEIQTLNEEINSLNARVNLLTRMKEGLMLNNSKVTQERNQLLKDNQVLGNELTYFREYAADLEEEVNALKNRCKELSSRNIVLESEIQDMKFTRKYLTSEDAGKRFAQELLGTPMTPEEIAIDKAENCYVPYSGDDF